MNTFLILENSSIQIASENGAFKLGHVSLNTFITSVNDILYSLAIDLKVHIVANLSTIFFFNTFVKDLEANVLMLCAYVFLQLGQ